MAKNTIQSSSLMRFIIEHRFEDSYIFVQRNDKGDDEIHIQDPNNQRKHAILNLDDNSILYRNTIDFYEKEISTPNYCT